MRILVTGSQEWPDDGSVEAEITRAWQQRFMLVDYVMDEALVIVHGDCPKGADFYARRFVENIQREAAQNGRSNGRSVVSQEAHPWPPNTGRGGGMMRNSHMVNLGADLCLAFIFNHSPGATDCATKAEVAGINTWKIERP